MNIVIDRKRNFLDTVINRFRASLPFRKLTETIETRPLSAVTVTGLAGSSQAILLSNLAEKSTCPIIAIMTEPDEANNLFDDLSFLMNEKDVAHFPSRMTPPYEFRSPAAEIVGQRLAALSSLMNNEIKILVTSIQAVIEPTISKTDFEKGRLQIRTGEETDIDFLSEKLVVLGFQKVTMVEEVGDFAQRGGLIDFFSPGFDFPVRVEFFGDTVDTIRHFDVATQRTTGRLEEVILLPRREVPITTRSIEQYIEQLPQKDADLIRARYLNDPELPGLEWLAISFGLELGNLTDFIPGEALFFLDGIANLKGAIDDTIKEAGRHYERIRDRMDNPPSVDDYYIGRERVWEKVDTSLRIDFVPFRGGREDVIDFQCREHPAIGSRLDLLGTTINSFINDNINFLIAADNTGQATRLSELLAEKIDTPIALPIEVALLKGGFVSRENHLAILTDHQIFGRSAAPARKNSRRGWPYRITRVYPRAISWFMPILALHGTAG
jgi:transcription-repair coupling factor (superfamily II helicase)